MRSRLISEIICLIPPVEIVIQDIFPVNEVQTCESITAFCLAVGTSSKDLCRKHIATLYASMEVAPSSAYLMAQ